MFIIIKKIGIIDKLEELPGVLETLDQVRISCRAEVPLGENLAKDLANQLQNKIPCVYGHSYLTVAAKRWQTQLNENAALLAFSGAFSEMNHNEIVGWADDDLERVRQFILVFLRSTDEHPRITKRFELTKEMLKERGANVVEIPAQGQNRLARILSTIYLGDFVSVYLAFLRGVDPTPVEAIENLKKQMGP